MKKDFFENLALPRTSQQESQETISRNKLALLFHPDLFEIRDELKRDKGNDLIIEIKKNNSYTNFRFVIQVKSTESAPNQDGSLSYPLDVSNINYLLNYGMPAYYILWDITTDKFYIETVSHVYQKLTAKYKSENFPTTLSVRFSVEFNAERAKEIYQETLTKGILMRKLSHHMNLPEFEPAYEKGIVIDEDNDVYSVEQNIHFINHLGLELLNNHEFKRIIEIEQRTHPRSKASGAFNMVCGVAYFHMANLFKAIELLKLAKEDCEKFDPSIRAMLDYTLLQAKRLLGILDEASFKEQISELVGKEDVGSFLKLEHAHKQFIKSKSSESDKVKEFYRATERIISEDEMNHEVRVIGYARLLDMEATLLLHELAKNYLTILGRTHHPLKTKIQKDWKVWDEVYSRRLQDLTDFAMKHKNILAVSNLISDNVRWNYSKTFHNYAFNNWDKEMHTVKGTPNDEYKEVIQKSIHNIDIALRGYEMSEHTENTFASLSQKYELQHFAGLFSAASETANRMSAIIKTYDLNGLKSRYDMLLNGGTRHENFFKEITEQFKNVYTIAQNCGLVEYIYTDISEDFSDYLKAEPSWSLDSLLPFVFPDDIIVD